MIVYCISGLAELGGQGGHWPPQIFQNEVMWWFAETTTPDKVFYYWPLQNFVASAGPEYIYLNATLEEILKNHPWKK